MGNFNNKEDEMSKYEIEKGVPIPEAKNKQKKYPIKEMEVGDSFLVVNAQGKTPQQTLNKFRTLLKYHKITSGKTFETRAMDDGVRVWRTA